LSLVVVAVAVVFLAFQEAQVVAVEREVFYKAFLL
jgi:hypothetical protein